MSKSGVSAAALAEAVQVGPEEVDEAGDLVSKAGLKHQAKELIRQMAAVNPPELVAALTRKEDTGRTKCLDASEVETFTKEIVGDALERVIHARVRGSQAKPEKMKVVALFELPSTRTARCVFDYARCTLSQRRYERALAAGEVDLADKRPGEDDNAALRRENDRLRDEMQRLSSEVADIRSGTPAEEEEGESLADQVAALRAELEESKAATTAPAADAEEVAKLREEIAELRAAASAPSETEREAGDASTEPQPAAEGDGAEKAEVEIPKNAQDIIAKVGEFSREQLAELTKDDRSTVAAAAKAELEQRSE